MDRALPVSQSQASSPEVSVIVPARNEEANLGACLESLTAQTGVSFEIIVVDDGSTDDTRQIAKGFAGVRLISAPPLLPDQSGRALTGKSNAVIAGAAEARAPWLLFTDADTVHLPGSLARALAEAKQENAHLLSYSPEQIVGTFAERAVMPVVFAELAAQYPPERVRNQNSGVVAANGQYILVRRAAYDSVGGHAAVATEILEDVALARVFRTAGFRVYFRYGGDAVRTRMYRNWPQLREGWTKNLALLFPHPAKVAARSLFQWSIAWFAIYVAAAGALTRHLIWILAVVLWLFVYRRIHAAHFSKANSLIAIACGLPLFAYLLLSSKQAYANARVSWKGRDYQVGAITQGDRAVRHVADRMAKLESHRLRTDS